jgi:hypothetical protein
MKYQLTQDQVSSKVAGETVILNHSKGAYYGLNEVGVLVWEELEKGPQTIESLCEVITQAYEVDNETCRTDVTALLKDLVSEKLVETMA